jgi:hypothetical protein
MRLRVPIPPKRGAPAACAAVQRRIQSSLTRCFSMRFWFFHKRIPHPFDPRDSRTGQPALGASTADGPRSLGAQPAGRSTPDVAPRPGRQRPTSRRGRGHRAHRLHRAPDPAAPPLYRCRSTPQRRWQKLRTGHSLPERGRKPPDQASANSISFTTVFSTPVGHAIPWHRGTPFSVFMCSGPLDSQEPYAGTTCCLSTAAPTAPTDVLGEPKMKGCQLTL